MERHRASNLNKNVLNKNVRIAEAALLLVIAALTPGCGKTTHGMPTLGDCGDGNNIRRWDTGECVNSKNEVLDGNCCCHVTRESLLDEKEVGTLRTIRNAVPGEKIVFRDYDNWGSAFAKFLAENPPLRWLSHAVLSTIADTASELGVPETPSK